MGCITYSIAVSSRKSSDFVDETYLAAVLAAQPILIAGRRSLGSAFPFQFFRFAIPLKFTPPRIRQIPMIHLGQLIEPRIGVSQRLMLRLADKWRPLSGARQEHAQDVSPSFGALRAEHESARAIDFVDWRSHVDRSLPLFIKFTNASIVVFTAVCTFK